MIAEYNLSSEDRVALKKSRIATTKGGFIILLGIVLPLMIYAVLLKISYNHIQGEMGTFPPKQIISVLVCVGIAIISWGTVIAVQGMIEGSRTMKRIEDRQKAGG
ncbi:hypothetical protein CMV30_04030 [Nibricoccus aquaticus]|uniref:DUF485 domain-containing protein n=1 Tax=Nibricoccus aquaticus TaxID=2576891 RepID=A0A290Q3E2_9BACT|nr:hypothetical protein [Nibricoccus aquaticus]ATC63189.1 hypothetical protein CMV30_04030 [Nibricoccus aquaticus]